MPINQESIDRVIEREVLSGVADVLVSEYEIELIQSSTGISTALSNGSAAVWFGKHKGRWIVADFVRPNTHDVHNMPLESICKLIAHITLD